jgi:hypothetical protein
MRSEVRSYRLPLTRIQELESSLAKRVFWSTAIYK